MATFTDRSSNAHLAATADNQLVIKNLKSQLAEAAAKGDNDRVDKLRQELKTKGVSLYETDLEVANGLARGGKGRTRRRTLKASTLRRMLKKKGKKTTGKKATLLKRLKE
jgi:hypothetical protein